MLWGVCIPGSPQTLPDEGRLREKPESSIAQVESRRASELQSDYALCWKTGQCLPICNSCPSCEIGTGGGDQASESQRSRAEVYLNHFCLENVRAEVAPEVPAIEQRNPQRADLLPGQGEVFSQGLYS